MARAVNDSPTMQLDVVDRIGGGDGFAAGLIYGLIKGRPPEEALRLGWAHGALLTTFPGDVSMVRLIVGWVRLIVGWVRRAAGTHRPR